MCKPRRNRGVASGGTAPPALKMGARWDEWSGSFPVHFIPGKRKPMPIKQNDRWTLEAVWSFCRTDIFFRFRASNHDPSAAQPCDYTDYIIPGSDQPLIHIAATSGFAHICRTSVTFNLFRSLFRVIQEDASILRDVTVSIIVRKKSAYEHCLILNCYRDETVRISRSNFVRVLFVLLDDGRSLQQKGDLLARILLRAPADMKKHQDLLTHNPLPPHTSCKVQ